MRSTWAVVLIHGVGETDTGATLGAFLPQFLKERSTLVENAAPQLRLLAEPAAGLPHPRAIEPPAPADETSKEPGARFPMYLRTFSNSAPGQPDQVALAEVFWSDLSKAGSTWWHVLLRLIWLVFDLRHVSNIAAAYPGLRWAGSLRLMLHRVSWLLCGPIAGLAIFLVLLLLAHYGTVLGTSAMNLSPSRTVREAAPLMFGLLAVVAVYVSWWFYPRLAEDETWRLFGRWIQIGGIVTAIVALCRFAFEAWWLPWGTRTGQVLGSRLLLGKPFPADPGATVTHAAVILWLGYFFFVLLALATVLAFAMWVLARREAGSRGETAAAPALDAALGASLLQVTLWVLLATGLGWAVLYFYLPLPEYKTLLQTVITGLILKSFVVAAIILCAGGIWGWRRILIARGKSDRLPRLLVHALIMAALIGLTLLSVLLFSEGFVTGRSWLHDRLEPSTRYIVWVVLLAAAVAVVFWKGVLNALHIVMDVTSHFHRRRLEPRQIKIDPQDFPTQQRIEARCRRVLQEVLQLEDVRYVTVIAHSQGTMVALDVLWLEWANNLLKGQTVYLVTMGSPISHLYQHYFPHRYPPLFKGGGLNPLWGSSLDRTIRRWINVYRVDDFVGTGVSGRAEFPLNARLKNPGGHTRYWKYADALEPMAPYLPGGPEAAELAA